MVNALLARVSVGCGALLLAGAAYAGTCAKTESVTTSVVQLNAGAEAKASTVVDLAIASENHKTLVAAVKAAGLVDTLKGEGPFTVFAPTDAAFAKLPKETLESLLKPENKDQLAAILKYHVVPGKVTAAEVTKLDKAKTVQGAEITIKSADGKVMINNATVTTADLTAGNGVVHVIDTVILPPAGNTASEK